MANKEQVSQNLKKVWYKYADTSSRVKKAYDELQASLDNYVYNNRLVSNYYKGLNYHCNSMPKKPQKTITKKVIDKKEDVCYDDFSKLLKKPATIKNAVALAFERERSQKIFGFKTLSMSKTNY